MSRPASSGCAPRVSTPPPSTRAWSNGPPRRLRRRNARSSIKWHIRNDADRGNSWSVVQVDAVTTEHKPGLGCEGASRTRICFVVSHPIQYTVPLYQRLARRDDIAIKVFFTWHSGGKAIEDRGFG